MIEDIKNMIKDPNFNLADGIKKISELSGHEFPEEAMADVQMQSIISLGQSVIDSMKAEKSNENQISKSINETIDLDELMNI